MSRRIAYRIAIALSLGALSLGSLGLQSKPAQAIECKLKHSWLVPTACPYCDWGANCNCC